MGATQILGGGDVTLTEQITPATKGRKIHIQNIVGILLYYESVVDPTIMVALRSVSANQDNSNEKTAQANKKLLGCYSTHLYDTIIYEQRDMVIRVQSDVSYLS